MLVKWSVWLMQQSCPSGQVSPIHFALLKKTWEQISTNNRWLDGVKVIQYISLTFQWYMTYRWHSIFQNFFYQCTVYCASITTRPILRFIFFKNLMGLGLGWQGAFSLFRKYFRILFVYIETTIELRKRFFLPKYNVCETFFGHNSTWDPEMRS